MGAPDAIFIHSDELERYHYPPGCPLSSQRAARTVRILEPMGLLGPDQRRAPEAAPRAELERFHLPEYLEVLRKASDGIFDESFLRMGLGTPDCPLFAGMYEYAALACGASLFGASAILSGEARVVFNPSGGYHHAMPASAAGFCYLNDVVLACLKLADANQRVLFVDVDAHHGDGVQSAFYSRRDVMTISFHESGETLYPGTGYENEIGDGAGEGFSVNLPLPVGTYDAAYLSAFREIVLPLQAAFAPDVIVVELGMDTLAGDPLAHLNLTNNVVADLVGLLTDLGKPVLATGGGGYHEENTARGWALCWSVLSGAAHQEDPAVGLGGVMLQSSEWAGGLRDRVLLTHGGKRDRVDQALGEAVSRLKQNVFPLHGLTP